MNKSQVEKSIWLFPFGTTLIRRDLLLERITHFSMQRLCPVVLPDCPRRSRVELCHPRSCSRLYGRVPFRFLFGDCQRGRVSTSFSSQSTPRAMSLQKWLKDTKDPSHKTLRISAEGSRVAMDARSCLLNPQVELRSPGPNVLHAKVCGRVGRCRR